MAQDSAKQSGMATKSDGGESLLHGEFIISIVKASNYPN